MAQLPCLLSRVTLSACSALAPRVANWADLPQPSELVFPGTSSQIYYLHQVFTPESASGGTQIKLPAHLFPSPPTPSPPTPHPESPPFLDHLLGSICLCTFAQARSSPWDVFPSLPSGILLSLGSPERWPLLGSLPKDAAHVLSSLEETMSF